MQVPVAHVGSRRSRGSRTFGAPPYDAGSGGAEGRDPWARRRRSRAQHRGPPDRGPGLRPPPRLPRDGRRGRSRRLRTRRTATTRPSGPRQAGRLTWSRPWDSVMDWNAPVGHLVRRGATERSVNCLDRHVEAGGGDKVAFHWEGEPGDTRVITYRDLLDEVCRLANALRGARRRQGRPREHLPGAWCPSCRSRCSRARGSARRIRSSSAGSAPRRCATASTTRRRRC